MTNPALDLPSHIEVSPLPHDSIRVTLDAVFAEILRQDVLARAGKFGGLHILPSGPDHARLAVLTEEVGEVARELNETLMGRASPEGALVKELIQVAACAVAWATAIDK